MSAIESGGERGSRSGCLRDPQCSTQSFDLTVIFGDNSLRGNRNTYSCNATMKFSRYGSTSLQSRYGATIQTTSPFCLPPSASIVHGPYFVKIYKGLRSCRFPLRVSRFARDSESSPRWSQTAYLVSASFSSSEQPRPFFSYFSQSYSTP